MSKTQSLQFVRHPHPSPVAADQARRAAGQSGLRPGLHRSHGDHPLSARPRAGTTRASSRARPIPMDPAAAVLHYAQEIFEGLKAYRTADGGATLFRPRENARRFQKSAERLAMPMLPEELFLEAVDQLVSIDRDWIPDGDGSLYLRPFMFANEIFLGVKPSSELPVHRHRLVGRRVLQVGRRRGFGLGLATTTRAPRRAAPAPPNAAATTPPACSPRPKRPSTAATRSCSSTRSSSAGSRNWAA